MRLMILAVLLLLDARADKGIALDVPISCKLHTECFMQRFVDIRAGKKTHQDFMGTQHTQSNIAGTTFRLKNLHYLKKNIPVLAAAEGTVESTGDDLKKTKKFSCGQNVIIKHPNGYSTQYCHLKKGSIKVKAGDKIKPGQDIGIVGMTGASFFPHLYFILRKNGTPVDPFSGPVSQQRVATGLMDSFWSEKAAKILLPLKPTAILNMGVIPFPPNKKAVITGQILRKKVKSASKVIFFWAECMGIKKGYLIAITIKDPERRILVQQKMRLKDQKENWMHFIQKKAPEGGFATGDYTMKIEISKPHKLRFQVIESHTETLTVEK